MHDEVFDVRRAEEGKDITPPISFVTQVDLRGYTPYIHNILTQLIQGYLGQVSSQSLVRAEIYQLKRLLLSEFTI